MKENSYSPIVYVRQEFPDGALDDETRALLNFYRSELRPGKLLDLGAGPTHLYYLAAFEDLVTHISALDISKQNLEVVREFLEALKGKPSAATYVTKDDVDMFRQFLGAVAAAGVYGSSLGDEREQRFAERFRTGNHMLRYGDMYDVKRVLDGEKYETILASYAFHIPKELDPHTALFELFCSVRSMLASRGRFLFAEFRDFGSEDILETYGEDEIVSERFHKSIPFTAEHFRELCLEAGFTSVRVEEPIFREGPHELHYFFVSATT